MCMYNYADELFIVYFHTYLKHKLRRHNYLSDIDPGDVCPVCPQLDQHIGNVCHVQADPHFH